VTDPVVDDLHEETLGRAFDARMIARLAPFARAHLRPLLAGVAVLFVLFAAEVTAPYLLRLGVDGPIARGLASGDPGAEIVPFLLHAGLFLLVLLLAGGFRYLEVSLMNRAGQGIVRDLRLALFEHFQRLPLAFYDRNAVGRLVTRVTSDVENVAEVFTAGAVLLLYDVVKVLGAGAVLLWIDVRLALVTFAFTPIVALVSLWFRGRARSSWREVRGALARLNAYLQEAISGIRVIQMFGQERKAKARFGEHVGRYRDANLRTVLYFALFFPLLDETIAGAWAAVLWVGGKEVLAGGLTIGLFLQFWWMMEYFFGPVRELGEKYNVMQAAMASAERVFRILDTEPTLAPPPAPRLPDRVRGAIEFDRVSFAYDGGPPVLRDVTFRVAPGETVAVVGPTGAGKSTLVSLLLRFYDVRDGSVRVDGLDVREWSPQELRRRIGLVLQDVFLFTGDVGENVRLGREEVSAERLSEAIRSVRADAVLERRGTGLATAVAERGVTFSAGERQLLAFARALAGEPAIVVLDEATANVDTETETRIREGIRTLLRGRTSLVIAHRLSTVKQADRILVLHRGEIREEGTHESLLRRGGLYARLYRIQSETAGERLP